MTDSSLAHSCLAHTNWDELIDKARKGCDDSLSEIISRLSSYLTLCAKHQINDGLQSKFGASDVVQTSLIDVCRSLDSFNGSSETELRAWLKQIVKNNLIDEVRRYTSTQSRSIDLEMPIQNVNYPLAARTNTSSAMLRQRESDEQLKQAILRLPIRMQRVVEARHRFGYTFDQIGTQLNVTESTARKIMIQATQKLKAWLTETDD